jgi:hypothetical protein
MGRISLLGIAQRQIHIKIKQKRGNKKPSKPLPTNIKTVGAASPMSPSSASRPLPRDDAISLEKDGKARNKPKIKDLAFPEYGG